VNGECRHPDGSSRVEEKKSVRPSWFRRSHRSLFWMGVFLALQSSCGWFGPHTIHITAEEFRFTPARIEWPSLHPVHLVIRNHGRERHVFHSPKLFGPEATVTWHQPKVALREANAIMLDPGQSIELMVTLAPGLYPFRCWIKGHTGMNGTILVNNP
jgi:plastocyanin